MITKRDTLKIVGLVVVGVLLLTVKADREYIRLQPTEGIPHGTVLETDKTYQQTFVSQRPTITRLGIFLRPAQANVPLGKVTIKVKRDDETIAEQAISTSFIDAEGAAQVRFDPPLKTTRNEKLSLEIQVSKELDGTLRLQQRQRDETFDATNVSFLIDGQPQPNPVGYQVYHRYRPALALQLGGLIILAAIFIATKLLPLYVLGAAGLFVIPAVLLGEVPSMLFIYAAAALSGMLVLLHKDTLGLVPSLVGAHVFAFSSWYVLQAQAGREYYAFIALLPLIVLLLSKQAALSPTRKRQLIAATIVLGLFIIVLSSSSSASKGVAGFAQPRDIFLDPNQVASSQKVVSASWDNFGSYVGVINALLAVVGIIWRGLQHKTIAIIGSIGALIAITPLATILTPLLPLPPQHFIVFSTFAIAYFAAWGLQGLGQYLAPTPHRSSKTAQLIIGILALIALLDLWQVVAGTLEYNLL